MPTPLRAVTVNGRHLDVASGDVIALSADRDDPDRTRFFLRGDVVTAEGRYEDWMAEFAQDWTGHLG